MVLEILGYTMTLMLTLDMNQTLVLALFLNNYEDIKDIFIQFIIFLNMQKMNSKTSIEPVSTWWLICSIRKVICNIMIE